MKLRNATFQDIDSIMQIEKDAFIPEIQESKQTFLNRIKTYSSGFVVFEEEYTPSEKFSLASKKPKESARIFGYLCSEKWNAATSDNYTAQVSLPANPADPFFEEFFRLGHSIEKAHSNGGNILYISSFAILSDFRGKKLGNKLFSQALQFILQKNENQNIKTVLLLVNEKWKSALKIYKNYGFNEVRKITGIFPDSNGIIMQLTQMPEISADK